MSDSELVFNPTPGIRYKHRYKDIFKDIAKGNLDKHKTLRTLILTDLWFVVYFVLGMPNANHQFVVNCCREVEDGPKNKTLDVWAREHLKCVSADTEVLMSNGSRKTAEEIKVGDRVVSLNTKGKSVIATVVAKEDNGVQDVVDIKTVDGRQISVTPNHRLLGFNKWVEASEFRPGDYIGIPRRCARDVKETMSVDEVKFISYMLAEGCCVKGSCDFTNTDVEIIDDFKNTCDKLGFKIGFTIPGIRFSVINGGRKFIRDWGLEGHKSTSKRVPRELFSQPDSHLIEFVRCFWACDGTVNLHSNQASITLANPGLIDDIRNILTFFGIYSTVSYFDNYKAGAWCLNVSEGESLHRLLSIGIGLKAKNDKLVELCSCKNANVPQGDEIPIEWTSLLNRKPRARYYRNNGVGISYKSSGTSRNKVARFAELDNNDKLRQVVNSDIRWVKVKQISRPYKAQTYDIQVEDTQVFVANGFISHNTSIITIGETIQDILKNPEETHCIFSYVKPIAKKFLFTIREIFEKNKALIKLFPDVLYENPSKESPLWSLDEGIVVKRRTNRKEPTVCASGLTEGMVTGMHFEDRKYDDIVTEDIGQSFDVMEDVKLKFDSSQNLGINGGRHRVIGTFYNYDDPLVYIKSKVDIEDPSKPAYTLRLKPATIDGSMSGDPVFLSRERLNELKLTKTFKCLPPGSRIVTDKGLLPIEKVQIGDMVLTHTGNYRKVLWTFKRQYNGDLVKIRTAGLRRRELLITPEHPVLLYDSLPKRKRGIVQYGGEGRWVEAGLVEAGKALFYPKKKNGYPNPYRAIIKTERVRFDGDVYNLEVDIDNSYVVEQYAVHNCQQLLDPAPEGTKKLNRKFVKSVKTEELPRVLHKVQIIDPAGKKGTGDPWASVIVGVSPNSKDVRASDLYLLDILLLQTHHSQTISSIVQMYREGGRILKICIEQVGQSTAEVHISSELKKYGINVTEENGRLVIFTPAGRNKEHRIEQGLSWHLDNGKIHVLDTIEKKYRDSFLAELDSFPFSNNDHIIDTLSYFILDLLPTLKFRSEEPVSPSQEIPFEAYT